MNKPIKFSLSIQVVDQTDVEWEVIPTGDLRFENNHWIYETLHDPAQRSTVTIRMKNKQYRDSHLIIKEIKLGGVELNNLPMWSRYVSADRTQVFPDTYGFMTEPGDYIMNIHYNAQSHNYMAYFRSCSKVDQ